MNTMDDDTEGSETASSEDELDITKVVRKELEADTSYISRTKPRPGSARSKHTIGERIKFSSDEEPDDAYQKFKNRKSLKRKRESRGRPKKSKEFKPKKNNDDSDQDEEGQRQALEDDDQLMQYTLPDYLQQRRTRFEERRKELKDRGLKLPPSYDEVDFSDNERLESLTERPTFPNANPTAPYKDIHLPLSDGLIPAAVAQWLRDYQVEGVRFLHKHFAEQTGCLLGDDMGLGKTIQVIAFLTAAFGKTGDERDNKRMRKMRRAGASWYPRALIVCPGTLIENWKAEFERWGWWHVDVFHGATKEDALDAAKSGMIEVMITTYTTYRNYRGLINCIEWDCVVADECHQIKGRLTETAIAMTEVNSLCRIGLTGTAIQNNYDELWTLLNWTNPGRLGPISTWRSTVSDPLRAGQSHDATMHQLGNARRIAKSLANNLLPRFFLRRMKTLIADQLPKKSDRVVFCPLTRTQADAYIACLESEEIEYIRTSTEICDCGSGKKSGWCCKQILPDNKGSWKAWIFPAMINLQKLANHLAILIPQGTDAKDKQEKDSVMLKSALPGQWRDLYRTRNSILHYSNTEFCGKWKVLRKLLQFWHGNGDKVLIFSHSVRLLKMFRMLMQNTSYNVSYLDGAMSYEDRAREVNDFNSDPQQFVFLISTKAGGMGLNITSANKVVVVDPAWNPSYDLQAQDRAYRIGQVRDVEVFRLVSAGTIEEIVYARQIYKQQQANIGYNASNERRYFAGVQANKGQKGEIFGLANLFSYTPDQVVLRNIVNKTNIAESRAGVQVTDIDLADLEPETDDADALHANSTGDGEDKAMSQLAALVADGSQDLLNDSSQSQTGPGGKKKKMKALGANPIHAILANAGVEYTHENSEVVGSSKIEAHLSRQAEENTNAIGIGESRVFKPASIPRSQPPTILDELEDSDITASEDEDGGTTEMPEYRFHPPQEVLKRQFCSMAKEFGFESATEFALVVEGWTQAGRRGCLERFYRRRRVKLGVDPGGRRKRRREDGGEDGNEVMVVRDSQEVVGGADGVGGVEDAIEAEDGVVESTKAKGKEKEVIDVDSPKGKGKEKEVPSAAKGPNPLAHWKPGDTTTESEELGDEVQESDWEF